jgi:hypothetical protein
LGIAVDTQLHLIVTHEVTNTGSDRSQLAKMASQAKEVLHADRLDVVADRGYFNSPEILACEQADITVTLPKPMTSGAKADGRFGKQDFVYLSTENVYRCPAGEKLTYPDGSMSMCSKPCSDVSMRTSRRCASDARRRSIRSRPSRCAWAQRTF